MTCITNGEEVFSDRIVAGVDQLLGKQFPLMGGCFGKLNVGSDGDFDLTKYLRRNCVDCGAQCCGGLRRVEIEYIRKILEAAGVGACISDVLQYGALRLCG